MPIEEDTVREAQLAGTQFGDYELCSEIARGGMGVVYRARHLKLQRAVALKMIRPERLACEADVRRFHNETVTIARLDHPNIIPILDVGQVDRVHYFTMRLVEGRDLNACCGRYRTRCSARRPGWCRPWPRRSTTPTSMAFCTAI